MRTDMRTNKSDDSSAFRQPRPPWRLALAALMALALVGAACGSSNDTVSTPPAPPAPEPPPAAEPPPAPAPEPPPAPAPEPPPMLGMEPLTVGYLLPQTGSLAFLSDPMIKAVELAQAEIEAGGLIVNLIPGDSGTSQDVASSTADDLLNEEVSAIIGAAASSISLSVIDKITGAGVMMMSPSNTSPTFTTYDDGGLYFRTAPPDLLQAQVLGDLVADDGVSAAGILYRADDYGRNLASALENRLDDNGVDVATSIAYDPESSSFDADIQQLLEARVNGVVLIAFEEAGTLIAGMIEAGIGPADMPLFMGDGSATGNLWELVDATNEAVLLGAKATAPSAAPEDGEPTFVERFKAYAGDEVQTIFSSHSYDALMVVTLAYLVAKSTDPAAIAAEIVGVTRDGTKCSDFVTCCELVAAGENIDYDGASGPLDFTDAGEPGTGSYDISEFNAEGGLDTLYQVVVEGM